MTARPWYSPPTWMFFLCILLLLCAGVDFYLAGRLGENAAWLVLGTGTHIAIILERLQESSTTNSSEEGN